MKIVYSCMGGLLVPVVLAVSLCGSGKPVMAISYGVQNDVDTGIRGNTWAFDTYTRSVRVWRKGPGRFCSVSTYDGSFSSIAGTSPGGKSQLPAGIRGTFGGTSTATFRARLTSHGPAKGFLGVRDFACSSADVKGAVPAHGTGSPPTSPLSRRFATRATRSRTTRRRTAPARSATGS